MSIQDQLDELNVVELPLVAQLGAEMGWIRVDGADEDPSTVGRPFTCSGERIFSKQC